MKKKIQRGFFRRWFRRLFIVGFVIGLLGVGFVSYTYFAPVWISRGRIFTDEKELPVAKVGLVFGTSDKIGGRENRYFRYRIDAAEKVWKAGKVKTIIVSGDNRETNYNEPEKMKAALVARGVPKERIVCDYAGLRTLDSVVRAKEVFGADTVLFLSQRFQIERAIYLAEAHDMEAYGFDAEDVPIHEDTKTKVREVGARVVAWVDVNITHTRPKHLGDKEELPD